MLEAPLAAPLVAFAASAVAVAVLRRSAGTLPRDIPNARSLHSVPMPRAGGYAVWAGFLASLLVAQPLFPTGLVGWLPPWLALAIVSARDDVRSVGVVTRLSIHVLAAAWAACALALGMSEGNDWPRLLFIAACLALLFAWSANLYNFMDGSDGLAGTMGATGFAAYGLAALAPGASPAGAGAAPACLALAAALLPFLAVNKPPATMFLGDVGAVPLGFLAAAFGAAGVVAGAWPAWLPLLVFLPFVADATVTLARRAARRERLWEGHRGHYYQRLALLGAGHRGTLAAYAAVMGGTTASALGCRYRAPSAGWWALAAWSAVLLMLFAAIDYHWRKKTNVPASP